MLEHKVLYTSDMHGNKRQFETFVEYALQIKPATVIIAGEIPPKSAVLDTRDTRYIDAQTRFLSEDLPALIKPLKEGLPNTNVFVMLGNDDCAVNLEILNAHPELYQDISGRRVRITADHEIVGYSFVPISPFGIKDFEKFDLSEIPEWAREDYDAITRACSFQGAKSVRRPSLGWELYEFKQGQEVSDSIQQDLRSELFIARPQNTIYVFHTPPYGTSLDIIETGKHVGSFAVNEFIQKHNPKLTLHGHIHETVNMSGRFLESLGHTVMISAGNHNYDSKLAVVEFDLYRPELAQRKKLPCGKIAKFFARLFRR